MSPLPPSSPYPVDPYRPAPTHPPLGLPLGDRRVGGVCAGLARSLGVNVMLLRLVMFISVFVTSGVSLALYALLWLIIPDDPRPALPPTYGSPQWGWQHPAVPGANWAHTVPAPAPIAPSVPARPPAFSVDPATYNPMADVYADAERRIDEAVRAQRPGEPDRPVAGQSHPNVVPLRPRPSDTLGERIL